jgi:hypothetical protein
MERMRMNSSSLFWTKGYGWVLGRAGLAVVGLLCRLLPGCHGQMRSDKPLLHFFLCFSFSSYFLFLNSILIQI